MRRIENLAKGLKIPRWGQTFPHPLHLHVLIHYFLSFRFFNLIPSINFELSCLNQGNGHCAQIFFVRNDIHPLNHNPSSDSQRSAAEMDERRDSSRRGHDRIRNGHRQGWCQVWIIFYIFCLVLILIREMYNFRTINDLACAYCTNSGLSLKTLTHSILMFRSTQTGSRWLFWMFGILSFF